MRALERLVSIAEASQHRAEIHAGKLHRPTFQFDDVADHGSLQGQRDPVDAEQGLEAWILIVSLGRTLDDDLVLCAAVTADECES